MDAFLEILAAIPVERFPRLLFGPPDGVLMDRSTIEPGVAVSAMQGFKATTDRLEFSYTVTIGKNSEA